MNEGGFDGGMESGAESAPVMDAPAESAPALESLEAPVEAPVENLELPPEPLETIEETTQPDMEALEAPPEPDMEALEAPPEPDMEALEAPPESDMEALEASPESDMEALETPPEPEDGAQDAVPLGELETPEPIPDSDELFQPMTESLETPLEPENGALDVYPLGELETPEPIPDSDKLFQPMSEGLETPPESENVAQDVVPLDELETPEPIPDSDELFQPMLDNLDAAPEGETDLSNDLEEHSEDSVNEQGAMPDYSFKWSGYETHERPEGNGPILSRGYNTTPDESFHPGTISGQSLDDSGVPDLEIEHTERLENSVDEGVVPNNRTGETQTTEQILQDSPTESLEEGAQPAQNDLETILEQMQHDYPEIVNHETRNLSREVRATRSPSEITSDGELKGTWEDGAFVLDDSYIPGERFNPEHKTIGEIKTDLRDTYGIELDRIPFVDDEADFSSLSVAHLDSDEIARERLGVSPEEWAALEEKERVGKRAEVFESRSPNFAAADRLAAERGIEIPTLGNNYTASELADWRQKNHFTWDEQLGKGYNLVPSVIHNNVAHTGLVSHSINAKKAMDDYDAHLSEHYWNEEDAPITIQEAIERSNNRGSETN